MCFTASHSTWHFWHSAAKQDWQNVTLRVTIIYSKTRQYKPTDRKQTSWNLKLKEE